MTSTPTSLDLDAIEARAAHLAEYACQDDGEGDTLAGTDVPALVAEIRRLRDELATATSEAFREAADVVRKTTAPADWDSDAVACWNTALNIAWNTALNIAEHELRQRVGTVLPPRRVLTDSEYNAAWHAVEGAAGEEGADPGTVLHAVLDRLGIDWQDAATPAACR
jgi:hypothetical protein